MISPPRPDPQMISNLPPSVVAFLRAHVDHVVKLRLLVTLHNAPRATSSISFVARALHVTRSQVRDMANELADDGLVRISMDDVELAPTSSDDRLAIADLTTWYERDRAQVLDVLRVLGRLAS